MIYKANPFVLFVSYNLETTYVESEIEIMTRMLGWGMPEQGWRKGPWTPEEDKLLSEYVSLHGEGRWSSVARSSGTHVYIVHIYYYSTIAMFGG